jgi:hypothetical protein
MVAAQHAPIRCKNLHHQRNQDNWQKILQPAHREPIHFRP